MRFSSILLSVFLCLICGLHLSAQDNDINYITFSIKDKPAIDSLTKLVSIDRVEGMQVWAYANKKELEAFRKTAIPFELLSLPQYDSKGIVMATTIDEMANWDRYPTYDVYVAMMNKLATDYPSICKLEEIETLASGRKLLALKISDNVDNDNEAEPELLYTSTIHGDEATGFIMLLRLADYLLRNYSNNTDQTVVKLVNNSEIWLNPAANPDGTYHGGNSSVVNAWRYNANSVDLNRNYPDPADGDHPDGESWQPETQAFMAFANNHHFVLSANFHGGAEVFNYPWDTWNRRTSDDSWWQYVGHKFADQAQTDANNNGYMDGFNDGISDGYDWYRITGGRQDYMNYWQNCREVTIEISNTKLISSDLLPAHWTYLRNALLNHLLEGLNGVHGTVKNCCGQPLGAKIEVLNHDADNSWVVTDPRAGDYYRYLKAGTYSLKFSATGYQDQVVNNVTVVDGEPTILNITMAQIEPELTVSPTSISTQMQTDDSATFDLRLSNTGGSDLAFNISASNSWITFSQISGTIAAGNSKTVVVTLNSNDLANDTYNGTISITGSRSATVPVSMTVHSEPEISLNKTTFTQNLLCNQTTTDTLLVSNTGRADLVYSISVKNQAQNPWLTIDNSGSTVTAGGVDQVILSYHPNLVNTGVYTTSLIIGGDFNRTVSVTLNSDTIPLIKLGSDSLAYARIVGQTGNYSLLVRNIGGGILNYHAEIPDATNHTWIHITNPDGSLSKGASTNLAIAIDATGLVKDVYLAQLRITSLFDTVTIPVSLTVDNIPEFYIPEDSMKVEVYTGHITKDTITLMNTGGSVLDYSATVEYTNGSNWLILQNLSGSLLSQQNVKFIATLDARFLTPGIYQANIIFGGSVSYVEPVLLKVEAQPELYINIISLSETLVQDRQTIDTVFLQNVGGGILNYSIAFELNSGSGWVYSDKTAGAIAAGMTDTLFIHFDANGLEPGSYTGTWSILSNVQKAIPVTLKVAGKPLLAIDKTELNFEMGPGQEQTGNFTIWNNGGSPLTYNILQDDSDQTWCSIESELKGTLNVGQETEVSVFVNTGGMSVGDYNHIINVVADDQQAIIGVNLHVFTGISQQNKMQVDIHPNPFSEEVVFKMNNGRSEKVELVIYNLIGLEIYRQQFSLDGQVQTIRWNGNSSAGKSMPSGVYLYRIEAGEELLTGKVLKE